MAGRTKTHHGLATELGGETRVLVADFDVVAVVLFLAVSIAVSKDDVGQITLAALPGHIHRSLQPVSAAVTQVGPGCQKGLDVTSGEYWRVDVVVEGDDVSISVSGEISTVTASAWTMRLLKLKKKGLYMCLRHIGQFSQH